MGQDVVNLRDEDKVTAARLATTSTASLQNEQRSDDYDNATPPNRGILDGEVDLPGLMIPDIEKAMTASPYASQEDALTPRSPPATSTTTTQTPTLSRNKNSAESMTAAATANVPDGASTLVGLFSPPGVTSMPKVAPSATDNPLVHHHAITTMQDEASDPTAASHPDQVQQQQQQHRNYQHQDRPRTPPPLQPRGSAAAAAGLDGPCPPSPSGLTWSKAGSTFNKFPATLIDQAREKIRSQQLEYLPRLVLRNRAFSQSANKVHIRHNKGASIYKLLRFNWFHVLLRWPTKYSLFLLLSIWTAMILAFAAVYVWYDTFSSTAKCRLGGLQGESIHFAGAFALSLETCTTVGYGLPNGVNSFFETECGALQVILYFQMAWSMLFNAFLMTFLYNRLGRSETRGAQVIFSNNALVSIVDGQVRFQVRLFDCDAKHPVVEAHVRMYCVMKQRPVPRPLRILQPDDELGSMVFLSFPSVVSHNIDMYSLLHPPVPNMLMKPCGLVLRQVDASTANRDDIVCPICGEAFGTSERWFNHVRYQQVVEGQESYPPLNTHLSLDLNQIEKEPFLNPKSDILTLQQYFKNNVSEIICLVEGIDPMQSGTFQALQSYRYEDVEWYTFAQFAPCLSIENKSASNNRIFSVDLDRYHDIAPDFEAERVAKEEMAAAHSDSIRAGDVTIGIAVPTTGTTPEATDHGGTDEKAASADGDATAATSENTPSMSPATGIRPRHRRIKTLSSGISDGLFSSPIGPGHKG